MDDANLEKRTAAALIVNLSSYLVTAALTMLAAQAVVFTFVVDKREHLGYFYLVAGIAMIAFTASTYVGGMGIYKLAWRGFDGKWARTTKPDYFNMQAGLLLLGVAGLVVSAVMGTPKQDRRGGEESAISSALARESARISNLERDLAVSQFQIKELLTRPCSSSKSSKH
jgi:hypothetical protein